MYNIHKKKDDHAESNLPGANRLGGVVCRVPGAAKVCKSVSSRDILYVSRHHGGCVL